MPNLIAFKGLNSYKDEDANNNVIEYILRSPYCDSYEFGLLMSYSLNIQSIVNQFRYVQSLRSSVQKKIHHFTLSMDDIEDEIYTGPEIMHLVVDYFSSSGRQVIAAHHYSSKRSTGLHPHIHVVLNNISMTGEVFNASNHVYGLFLNYLNEHTSYKWRLCFENQMDYG